MIDSSLLKLRTNPASDTLYFLKLIGISMMRIREINQEHKLLSDKTETYINFVCDKVLTEAEDKLRDPIKEKKLADQREYMAHYRKDRKDSKHVARSLCKILGEDEAVYETWSQAYDGKTRVG